MFEDGKHVEPPHCPRCGKPFLAVCEDYIPIVLYFCDKHGWHFIAEALALQKWSAAASIH
jgi:hypothetical protein